MWLVQWHSGAVAEAEAHTHTHNNSQGPPWCEHTQTRIRTAVPAAPVRESARPARGVTSERVDCRPIKVRASCIDECNTRMAPGVPLSLCAGVDWASLAWPTATTSHACCHHVGMAPWHRFRVASPVSYVAVALVEVQRHRHQQQHPWHCHHHYHLIRQARCCGFQHCYAAQSCGQACGLRLHQHQSNRHQRQRRLSRPKRQQKLPRPQH